MTEPHDIESAKEKLKKLKPVTMADVERVKFDLEARLATGPKFAPRQRVGEQQFDFQKKHDAYLSDYQNKILKMINCCDAVLSGRVRLGRYVTKIE